MLPEQLRLLISAYASGDLSPRRRAAAQRLLRHSVEARRLLKELKLNRRLLRALSRPALPPGFTERVVKAVPVREPIIQSSPVIAARRTGTTPASRWAVAAGVCFAVTVGMLLYVSWPEDA